MRLVVSKQSLEFPGWLPKKRTTEALDTKCFIVIKFLIVAGFICLTEKNFWFDKTLLNNVMVIGGQVNAKR